MASEAEMGAVCPRAAARLAPEGIFASESLARGRDAAA